MARHAPPTWPSLPQWRRRWLLGALLTGGLLGWLARADAAASVRRAPRARATPAPPAALIALLDHLIPADELTPAASALRVPQQMWAEAQTQPELLRLAEVGCTWLDRYGDGFASLQFEEREALVAWMARAPWESPQRRLFYWARERGMTLYYAQPASWRGLPITRPPQPLGYEMG